MKVALIGKQKDTIYSRPELAEYFIDAGVELFSYTVGKATHASTGSGERVFVRRTALSAVIHALFTLKADTIHFTDIRSALLGAIIVRVLRPRIRVIVTIDHAPVAALHTLVGWCIDQMITHRAKLKRALAGSRVAPFHIPQPFFGIQGMTSESTRQLRSRYGLEARTYIVIYGSYTRQAGLHTLLSALDKNEAIHGFKIVIIDASSTGADASVRTMLATRADIDDRLHVLGAQSPENCAFLVSHAALCIPVEYPEAVMSVSVAAGVPMVLPEHADITDLVVPGRRDLPVAVYRTGDLHHCAEQAAGILKEPEHSWSLGKKVQVISERCRTLSSFAHQVIHEYQKAHTIHFLATSSNFSSPLFSFSSVSYEKE